jgi:hypothetical protein
MFTLQRSDNIDNIKDVLELRVGRSQGSSMALEWTPAADPKPSVDAATNEKIMVHSPGPHRRHRACAFRTFQSNIRKPSKNFVSSR